MLDGADEAGGVGQGVEGAGVEPGGAAGQDLHGQPAGLQVGAVDVGDLVLAAGGGLEVLGDLDDVVVVEVQAGHGVVGRGWAGFSSMEMALKLSSNSTTP